MSTVVYRTIVPCNLVRSESPCNSHKSALYARVACLPFPLTYPILSYPILSPNKKPSLSIQTISPKPQPPNPQIPNSQFFLSSILHEPSDPMPHPAITPHKNSSPEMSQQQLSILDIQISYPVNVPVCTRGPRRTAITHHLLQCYESTSF